MVRSKNTFFFEKTGVQILVVESVIYSDISHPLLFAYIQLLLVLISNIIYLFPWSSFTKSFSTYLNQFVLLHVW
jgi:hypothetical protein